MPLVQDPNRLRDGVRGLGPALLPILAVVALSDATGAALRALADALPAVSRTAFDGGWLPVVLLIVVSAVQVAALWLLARPDVARIAPVDVPSVRSLGGVALASLAIFVWGGPVSGAINDALGLHEHTPTELLNYPTVALVLAAVVVAPLVEELLFRGALFGAVLDRFDSLVLAVAVSSLAFGLVHVEYGVGGVLSRCGSGCLYAALRVRYDRLTEPMLAHAATNAVAVGAFLLA